MTVRGALNRGYNLVGTALVAISGFAFFPESLRRAIPQTWATNLLRFCCLYSPWDF